MAKWKNCTSSVKAQIVQEILREDKVIAQIASGIGIHPNQFYHWKKQALNAFTKLFEEDRKSRKCWKPRMKSNFQLYAEIG